MPSARIRSSASEEDTPDIRKIHSRHTWKLENKQLGNGQPISRKSVYYIQNEVMKRKEKFHSYRMHDLDPVFFTNGFRFDWRNGDVVDDRGFKCIVDKGGHVVGSPTQSNVTSYAWVYVW
ncbi:unnamed protein product [Adineta steineri]|uniref:Uncharacterized protein n=1 Tax=Adineta steineri TaxID=433720 RepID=A0A815MI21_9BILA|nr:unnamed protein product [Adineta steineri]